MAEKKKEDRFYVEVKNAVDARRNILETSKDILSALEMYERFREARQHKIEAMGELKKIFGEIYRLMSRLNSSLPKVKINKKTEKKLKAEEIKKEKTEEEPIKITELDKLERELSEVESKIASLS